MPKLNANGLEIEYDEFGNKNDPVILLIMGLATQMIAWSEPFCKALANGGYRVIRFDNRDVGLSEKMHGQRSPNIVRLLLRIKFGINIKVPYTLNDMANDAIGVLDALDIDAAHIVGASMGGMIGQVIAIEYPTRALSLSSIMSTTGSRKLPQAKPHVFKRMLKKRPNGDDKVALIKHMVKTFQIIGSVGEYSRTELEWYDLIEASVERNVYPQGFFRQFSAIVHNGSRVTQLKKIDIPTLVIHGQADPLVPIEHGIDTAKVIQNARLEIIEDMGHDLPPKLVPKLADLLLGHITTTE